MPNAISAVERDEYVRKMRTFSNDGNNARLLRVYLVWKDVDVVDFDGQRRQGLSRRRRCDGELAERCTELLYRSVYD
jgi:hypothetical protein